MVSEITASQLQARRVAGTGPVVIDVREGWELQLASIPGVLHIPMNEIPAKLAELDKDSEIVVMCRSGGRSMQVAQFLARNGFQSVANLTGGILAWSREVDPSVQQY
jgi:rhodanese-related sulfurtransferase